MRAKLDSWKGGEWAPHVYPARWARERTSGPDRLRITVGGGCADLVRGLAAVLEPPFKLLYVLHTPRTDAPAGRYESPPLDRAEVEALFGEFGEFWSQDGRHDVWLHSRPDAATIVWDRHDVIYGYGPLERLEAVLVSRGLSRGEPVLAPSPHAHRYHPEWDEAERALTTRGWIRSPLHPSDEQ